MGTLIVQLPGTFVPDQRCGIFLTARTVRGSHGDIDRFKHFRGGEYFTIFNSQVHTYGTGTVLCSWVGTAMVFATSTRGRAAHSRKLKRSSETLEQ